MDRLLAIGGIIISLLGVITGYIFYRMALRTKEPCWAFRNINLIQDYAGSIENLDILYKHQKIESLSVGKLVFWNNGGEALDEQDLATINPVRIVGGDSVKILDVQVLSMNNPSSQFSANLADNNESAKITFNYLNKNQGGVIQVIHTGKNVSEIKVIGDIKGVYQLKNRSISRENKVKKLSFRHTQRKRYIGLIVGIYLEISTFYSIYYYIFRSPVPIILFTGVPISTSKSLMTAIFLLLAIIYGFFTISMWLNVVEIPKGLELFNE